MNIKDENFSVEYARALSAALVCCAITANVQGLCDVVAFKAQKFQTTTEAD